MKRLIQKLVLACVGGSLLVYGIVAYSSSRAAEATANKAAPQATPPSTNPAMDDADKFMWEVFVRVNQQSGQAPAPGDSVPAMWETWSSDEETFPNNGVANAPCFPNHPNKQYDCNQAATPTFAATARNLTGARKRLRAPAQQQLIAPVERRPNVRTRRGGTASPRGNNMTLAAAAETANTANPIFNGPDVEEVTRNQAAFDFIVQNNLYTVKGLTEQFNKGFVVKFPVDAIEVKARWTEWSEIVAQQQKYGRTPDKSHYHVTSVPGPNGQPVVYGLVGLHIMTKDIPNWVWATWEQEDNPGRCDYIGCHDDFGSTPANVPPMPTPTPSTYPPMPAPTPAIYPPGQLTPELQAMMSTIGAEWQHYRLKGAQNDFTTDTGEPIIVGNSVTEDGFVQTSSCMTCHALATFAPGPPPKNKKFLPIFTNAVQPPAGDQTVAFFGAPGITCKPSDVKMQNCTQGPPGAGFWVKPYNPFSNPKGGTQRQFMTTDFVWAIPFFAH